MLEIVDIRDATDEEIKEYTRKQESPEWQQQGTVKDVMNKLSKQEIKIEITIQIIVVSAQYATKVPFHTSRKFAWERSENNRAGSAA